MEKDAGRLRDGIARMAGLVEAMIETCLGPVMGENADLLERNFQKERDLNRLERELSEWTVDIMSGYKLPREQLRVMVCSLRMVTDLERMGDLCVNLSRKLLDLSEASPLWILDQLKEMLRAAQAMLSKAIRAYLLREADLASEVLADDQWVDRARDSITRRVLERVQAHRGEELALIEALLAARNIERLADKATHVAEAVVYLVDGRDLRHKVDESHEKPGSWSEIRGVNRVS